MSTRVLSNRIDEDKVKGNITLLQQHIFLVKTCKYRKPLQLGEDGVSITFTPLQLDVFHARWGLHHCSDGHPLPTKAPTREGPEAASRVALEAHPVETKVGEESSDIRRRRNFIEEVYDFSEPYRRVRYPNIIGRSLIATS